MARGKKTLSKPIRASFVLEEEQWAHVKRVAIKMSAEQGRLITPTEAIRLAVNSYFPRAEQLDFFAAQAK